MACDFEGRDQESIHDMVEVNVRMESLSKGCLFDELIAMLQEFRM